MITIDRIGRQAKQTTHALKPRLQTITSQVSEVHDFAGAGSRGARRLARPPKLIEQPVKLGMPPQSVPNCLDKPSGAD
jgi:hypothetical protein